MNCSIVMQTLLISIFLSALMSPNSVSSVIFSLDFLVMIHCTYGMLYMYVF